MGFPKTPPEVDILRFVFKEIKTTGARVYRPVDYPVAIALLAPWTLCHSSPTTMAVRDVALGLERMHDAGRSLKILFAP